jgi:osmotically inducible protein OsmC
MPTSRATATWNGVLRSGTGEFKAESGVFAGPYSFQTRFEGAAGADPEELIAAAHAACYSMALSAGLDKAGTPSTRITTDAACTLEIVDGAAQITRIELTTRGVVEGIDAATFQEAAESAKDNCPVSKLFRGNVTVALDAALES